MYFAGLEKADLADLLELNRGFLELLGAESAGQTILANVPDRIVGRMQSLTGRDRRRLARVPFLLCTCHAGDVEYWQALLAPGAAGDLFVDRTQQGPGLLRLTSGVIGFAWQLARKNPFAARLLTGASAAWCEEIASQPLLRLIESACRSEDGIRLRMAHEDRFWGHLLRHAVSDDPLIRRAARTSGLQRTLLSTSAPTRLPLAAKSIAPPRQRHLPP